MAIKTSYENQDDIPEFLKEHSRQDGEKWVIDVEDIEAHPKVVNLRNAYQREKEKRNPDKAKITELENKLSMFPEDFDPEQWEAAKNIKPGDADKQRQELRAAMEAKWAKERDLLNAQIKTKDQFLEKIIKQDRLRAGLIAAGIDPKLLAGAMALLQPRITIKQDGESFIDVVDTDMGPVTAKDYAQQWVQSDEGKPYVLPASGPNLKGNQGNNAGNDNNPWSKEHFNLTEQARILRAEPQKAARLMASAK